MSKLNQLKNNDSDRMKVLAWLAHIKETDQRCIDEVIEQCKGDPWARQYFVKRHDEDVLQLIAA
jgi:hypothetical protein